MERFLEQWDNAYLRGLDDIPMFHSSVTHAWTVEQRRFFVKVFYHVRGHFGELLFALGNAAPDARFKNILLDNLRDEFGGDEPSHEQLYIELARTIGCDVSDEYLSESHYLPFVRLYNAAQITAIRDVDWESSLAGFAAGERLDRLDYSGLRGIFESFGLTADELRFFDAHTHSQHYGGPVATLVKEVWARSPERIEDAFERVRHFQLSMWTALSESVAKSVDRYSPLPDGHIDEQHVAHTHSGSARFARASDIATSARVQEMHYDSSRCPRLATRYSDLVALDTGDASQLQLHIDEPTMKLIQSASIHKKSGTHVLVFGANGFIGCHIAHRLLSDARVERVYAIIRPRTDIPLEDRLLAAWRTYELDASRVDTRKLMVLRGAMDVRDFGLDRERFDELARTVDSVFQCAGSTDYALSYLELRAPWVLGLLGVLQFCMKRRIKQLCYIGSTIAHLYQDPQDFSRADSWWYSGYAQMKWVNQTLLHKLMDIGFRAHICEAPYVLGSITIGKDPGYAYSLWRGLRLGAALQLAWDGELPAFAPVDILADAVVDNALSATPVRVIRPSVAIHQRIADYASMLRCKVVPWPQFFQEIQKYASSHQLQLIPADTPELIAKTNLPAVFPVGFDSTHFPHIRDLARLYLTRMNFIQDSG